jgi:hypothetical protein
MQRRSWLDRFVGLRPGGPIKRTPTKRKQPKSTGPSVWVRRLVYRRAGGRCEFSMCGLSAACIHHRYERKRGGVGPKSPAFEWINQPQNLLAACLYHNDWCSNQHPAEAAQIGWLWRSGDPPAADLPVVTSHDPLPVYLNPDGSITRFEERAV